MELRRKVMMGMVMLSSVCCLCEERNTVLPGINAFMQDFHSTRNTMQLEISKLLALVEHSWCARDRSDYDRHSPYLEFLLRNRGFEGSSLTSLLGNYQLHEPFRQSHNHLFENQPYIYSFLHWTTVIVKIASLNQDFIAFIDKLPSTSDLKVE